MSNEKKAPQAITSTSSGDKELASTYRPEPKSGPSENVRAVWGILQQNWPNAFKKVDIQDPAKVWADNLDDLSSREMIAGLKALRRLDERYMPNAPTCRALIKESLRAEKAAAPPEPVQPKLPGQDEISEQWLRLRGYVWMAWAQKMILQRGCDIDRDMSSRCAAIAPKKTAEYEAAWRTESDRSKDNWMLLARGAVADLMKAWNRICKVSAEKQLKTYEELYPPGDS